MTASEMGACIGSGSNGGTIGDIIINDSYVQTQNCNGAGIGSGISNSSCGDIYINNSKIYGSKYISRVDRIDIKQDASVPFGGALTTSFGANIGSGCKSSSGNIYINDSYCRGGDSSYGAAIGSGYYGASRDIIINNSEILAGAGGSEFTSKDNFDIYLSSGDSWYWGCCRTGGSSERIYRNKLVCSGGAQWETLYNSECSAVGVSAKICI